MREEFLVWHGDVLHARKMIGLSEYSNSKQLRAPRRSCPDCSPLDLCLMRRPIESLLLPRHFIRSQKAQAVDDNSGTAC